MADPTHKILQLRVTVDEYRELQATARARSMSLSEMIRQALAREGVVLKLKNNYPTHRK
jgi:post-segregation antitoxin (ccd killing protein)